MAAITNNIESRDADGFETSDIVVDSGPLGGFGGPAATTTSIAQSHTQLSKAQWFRAVLERELTSRKFELRKVKRGYAFIVDPPFDKKTLPFSPFAVDDYCAFWLWNEDNSKMTCPSFSLPAGGLAVGGSCPGADAGQTNVPVERRQALLMQKPEGNYLRNPAPGSNEPVFVAEGLTICGSCYAAGISSFTYANNLVKDTIRYFWLRQRLEEGKHDFLLHIFLDSIKTTLKFPADRHGIKPIRLHDSGDFFSYRYAELWIAIADDLADEMPDVIIWAPTRTWAQGRWQSFWAERLPRLHSLRRLGKPNLVVRPSGYNFGDAAPGSLHPSNAKGSTSLFAEQAVKVPEWLRRQPGVDPRVDYDCQVYHHDATKETACVNAPAPDGRTGCRACWVHPELSINYTAH